MRHLALANLTFFKINWINFQKNPDPLVLNNK